MNLYTEYSLKENIKSRFQMLIQSIRGQSDHRRCLILVLDQTSAGIIDSFYNMNDLLDLGVSTIEKLELKRKKYPKIDCLYFITPLEENLARIAEDFSTDEPFYRKINIYFTSKIQKEFLIKLGQNQQLVNRIVTIKEFNHHLYFVDPNTFTINNFNFVSVYYSKDEQSARKIYLTMINEILTILPSLEKYCSFSMLILKEYKIQPIFKEMIVALQKEIINQKDRMDSSKKSNQSQLDPSMGNVFLLVVERSIDIVTPILHDFHYQSLLTDLLLDADGYVSVEKQDKSQNAENTSTKFKLASYSDPVYEKYRYKHIAEALEGIPQELIMIIQQFRFQKMVASNPTARVHSGQIQDLDYKSMQIIIAQMPHYNEMLKHYSFHMQLIDSIWKKFESRGLKDIGELEQALATGTTKSGSQTKSEKLLEEVFLVLQSKILSESDKLRLVLIAIITLQLPQQSMNELVKKLDFEDQRIVSNLIAFGHDPTQFTSVGRVTKNVDSKTREMAKKKLSQMTLELQRHTPMIERIVDEFFENISNQKLSQYELLPVEGQLTLQNKKQKQQKSARKRVGQPLNEDEEVKNTLIIFMIGGISTAEITALRQLELRNPEFNILIGTTEVLISSKFFEQIKQIQL